MEPTNSTTAEDRLAKLGIHLPDAPTVSPLAGRSVRLTL
jgi:hypothetical protein